MKRNSQGNLFDSKWSFETGVVSIERAWKVILENVFNFCQIDSRRVLLGVRYQKVVVLAIFDELRNTLEWSWRGRNSLILHDFSRPFEWCTICEKSLFLLKAHIRVPPWVRSGWKEGQKNSRKQNNKDTTGKAMKNHEEWDYSHLTISTLTSSTGRQRWLKRRLFVTVPLELPFRKLFCKNETLFQG